MTPEGKVKARAYKTFKRLGVWYATLNADNGVRAGRPDCVCCVNGFFVAVEFKATEKNKPTKLQKFEMHNIRCGGGLTLVVNDGNVSHLDSFIYTLQHHVSFSLKEKLPEHLNALLYTEEI